MKAPTVDGQLVAAIVELTPAGREALLGAAQRLLAAQRARRSLALVRAPRHRQAALLEEACAPDAGREDVDDAG